MQAGSHLRVAGEVEGGARVLLAQPGGETLLVGVRARFRGRG